MLQTYQIASVLLGGRWHDVLPGTFTLRPFGDQPGFHAETSMRSVAEADGAARYAEIAGPLSAIQAVMGGP